MVGQYDWRDFILSELILDAAEFRSPLPLDPGSLNCFRSRDWNKHFPQRCNRELPWEARTGIAYHDQDSSLAVAAHQALFPAAF